MLEALSLSCGWGSFYNAKTMELRTWDKGEIGTNIGNIEISCNAIGEEQLCVEISISSRISAKINKEKVSLSELRASVPALCFLPGDMNIIDGTPAIRRVFIDKLCTILSIPYAKRLSDYKRLIRHRIKLLRMGKSPGITSHLMSSLGSWIWSVRSSVVKMLNDYLSINKGLSELSPFPLKLNIKPGGNAQNDVYCEDEPRITKSDFLDRLEFYSEMELKAKMPLTGPHRDDILILVNGKKEKYSNNFFPASFLSRGQKKRAVISLLLASGHILKSMLKRKPIFLLDEIFSELDEEARHIVATAFYETGWQIFASSAENSLSNWRGKVYNLSDGDIV
jgi:DNA replication and repair protein RecF